MIGLYILTNLVLDAFKTIKIGMSMRLEERLYDYEICFANNRYLFCYELETTKDVILIIEAHILKLTKHLNNREYFATEYRKITDEYDLQYYHHLIISSLDECGIKYVIHENPVFDKTMTEKKSIEQPEELNSISEEDYFKLIKKSIVPNEQQINVLSKIKMFYQNYDIGKIIWACGLGKALLGIMIAKELKFSLVVIGVPSIFLQKQMKNEIVKLFSNTENILYIGSESDMDIPATTNKDMIKKFIESKKDGCKFIITTYDSCFLLANSYTFDFKIGDEAHHLVGITKDNTKSYQSFHQIRSTKTLFMTATEKMFDNFTNNVFSMDDETVFGKLIDSKSTTWAIDNKKITDYNVLILNNTESEIDDIVQLLRIDVENRELLCSAFMTLKAMVLYLHLITHILIYANNIKNAIRITNYIDAILKSGILKINSENFYNKSLHSQSKTDLAKEIEEFTKAPFGIISCVYIFGEGFDLPKLNGVTFAENMDSDIRIVQSTLRANRIDKTNPNKIANIIIPYIDTCEHQSFNRCIKIISKLRNVDETISQKIKFKKLGNVCNDIEKETENYVSDLIDDPIELSNIRIKLINSKALGSKLSPEQLEYNYVRQINKSLNLQSKEDYFKVRDIHRKYISEPEEYFKQRGVWMNWYDFIGSDTSKFIQSKEKWIKFCKEKNIKSLLEYKNLCEKYTELPSEPCNFYRDFSTTLSELNIINKRR